MKTIKRFWALFIIIVAILPACKKYPDGPGLSLRSKKSRVVNEWKIDKYFRNGADATSTLIISGFTETFTESGTYTRYHIDSSGDPITQPGTWAFDGDKERIVLNGAGSFELSAANSTVSASSLTILRLKNKELWYKFENGGDVHEFHMVPK